MIGNRTRDFTHASRLLYFCATETVTDPCPYVHVYVYAGVRKCVRACAVHSRWDRRRCSAACRATPCASRCWRSARTRGTPPPPPALRGGASNILVNKHIVTYILHTKFNFLEYCFNEETIFQKKLNNWLSRESSKSLEAQNDNPYSKTHLNSLGFGIS